MLKGQETQRATCRLAGDHVGLMHSLCSGSQGCGGHSGGHTFQRAGTRESQPCSHRLIALWAVRADVLVSCFASLQSLSLLSILSH